MSNERLGHILLRKGLIESRDLDFCLNIQKNNGKERLGRVLRHYDLISERHIAQALAQQVGWEEYTGEYLPDEETAALLGLEFLLEHAVFPAREKEGVVFVLSRTDDLAATDRIQSKLAVPACFRLAAETDVRRALDGLCAQQKAEKQAQGFAKSNDLSAFLEFCLNTAIDKNATDIHVEASQKAAEIRFRIDGILYFFDSLRLEQLPRLVNVIFHKAEVGVSDFGHFHDARFSHRHLDRTVDVRVSHIPSVHGPSVVLRLLERAKTAVGLMELGYGQKQWDFIQTSLIKPEGITLIIGPTGCGKTTTLYAMLNHLKSISRKIVTIEDPVEMHLPLALQVQTNEKRGVSFGSAVRAFLRHDPNIILIGEVRDKDTAQEAIRAAMTGHKVFATLHANRPIDAILRLNDLGIPFVHLAGNLTLLVTQRLLRRLCRLCRQKKKAVKSRFAVHQQKYLDREDQNVWEPQGCLYCQNGFKGRAVASEGLLITKDMEIMIGKGQIMELSQYLQQDEGYTTMFDDARRLVQEGTTSICEAVRVLG